MIRIGICDDDEVIASRLEDMIRQIEKQCDELFAVTVYHSGKEMYEDLNDSRVVFEIIFLDIAMPQMDGVEVGYRIREELDDSITQIVYISSQSNYAMNLFQIRPFDFLIKPFSIDTVEAVIRSALKTIQRGQQRFTVMIGRAKDIVKIRYSDIIFFQSHARKIKLHTINEDYEFYEKMDRIYEEVESKNFLYIHKSYIVNYSHIIRMTYESVYMSDGSELTISPSKRKQIRRMCMQFEGKLE